MPLTPQLDSVPTEQQTAGIWRSLQRGTAPRARDLGRPTPDTAQTLYDPDTLPRDLEMAVSPPNALPSANSEFI